MTIFWISFAALLIAIILLDQKYRLLRDNSIQDVKPYSFSRVQLAWWTLVIVPGFVTAVIKTGTVPALYDSTLILLGISGGTLAAARVIDVSDQNRAATNGTTTQLNQNQPAQNFVLDIVSDGNGASVHRLQMLAFNLTIGGWFIFQSLKNIAAYPNICSVILRPVPGCETKAYYFLPDVSQTSLILIGLSAGTYAALKAGENK